MNQFLMYRKDIVRQNEAGIYQESVREENQKVISQSKTLILWIIKNYTLIEKKNFDFDKQFNY